MFNIVRVYSKKSQLFTTKTQSRYQNIFFIFFWKQKFNVFFVPNNLWLLRHCSH